jgi:WD40 repeat protein
MGSLTPRCVLSGHHSWALAAAFHPLGNYVITGAGDATLIQWSSAGKRLGVLPQTAHAHQAQINGVGFHPSGDYACTASWDQKVIVWSGGDLQQRTVIHTTHARSMRVGLGVIAVGGYDGSVELYLPDGHAVLRMRDCEKPVWGLALSS